MQTFNCETTLWGFEGICLLYSFIKYRKLDNKVTVKGNGTLKRPFRSAKRFSFVLFTGDLC